MYAKYASQSSDGHWRKLKSHQVGKGPSGEDTYGRTWVKRKKKYGLVDVKSTKLDKSVKPITQKKKGKTRSQRDLEMWKKWKEDPSDANLVPLMESLQGLVTSKVSEFRTAPVPPSAVRGAANVAVMKALNTYNPNKGAALHTYVSWHLKKVRSFVVKYQNIGRIPEHRAYRITEYKNAKAALTEKHDMPPDALTLSEHLGWSMAEVGRMENELRKDLIASRNLEADKLSDLEAESGREREVLRYIYYDLDKDERAVFEYSLGMNGKPKLSAGQIAKKMGISQPKVSRLRKKIDNKINERLRQRRE